MQALVCLAELEGLHIQQSASAFDKCNKEGLVRGLWRNHKHERKVCYDCYNNNKHCPQVARLFEAGQCVQNMKVRLRLTEESLRLVFFS